jgi:hypothetical protein
MSPLDRSTELFAAVAADHGLKWTPGASPKFGANALRVHDKIFAALTHSHRLLLKLPTTLVTELLAAKRAQRFESGGRVMNGWVTLAPNNESEWIALSREARVYVAAEAKRRKK